MIGGNFPGGSILGASQTMNLQTSQTYNVSLLAVIFIKMKLKDKYKKLLLEILMFEESPPFLNFFFKAISLNAFCSQIRHLLFFVTLAMP